MRIHPKTGLTGGQLRCGCPWCADGWLAVGVPQAILFDSYDGLGRAEWRVIKSF